MNLSRRGFLAGAAAAGMGALAPTASASRVKEGDRVRVAVIGTGGMGSRHIEALAVNPNCRVVALCDVYTPRFEQMQAKVEELSGRRPAGYQDFRRVLERKDVDAIFIATPDHWHPLLTILGCESGKDVYVEKPVCTTIEEGRAMVNAARRYGRIVQVGTQQRSMPVFQKAIEVIHQGRIGRVTSATAFIDINGWGVGETPTEVPEGLDWDLWLGPAPKVPFSNERFGGFMGWHDYARGGQLTNWGVHLMDILHWGIRADKPLNVSAIGGNYRQGPGQDNFENIEAIFEYPGCNVTWEQRTSNIHQQKFYGIRFFGTEGQLVVDRGSYVVRPSSLGVRDFVGEPEKSWANDDHHNNFFHCIRTRETPAADIEQGFRSTATVLLAGIALKTGRRLDWDATTETFPHDPQANRHLTRAYRAPWHL
jgi:predicted dehydrogenase